MSEEEIKDQKYIEDTPNQPKHPDLKPHIHKPND